MATTLTDLQARVRDLGAFGALIDYYDLCHTFLSLMHQIPFTRIVSPSQQNYVFYQYDEMHGYRITRPLNVNLFVESADDFSGAFERFIDFLSDLKRYQRRIVDHAGFEEYFETRAINKVIYTIQQAIGSVADSFDSPNQARKRVGQLFETLVKLVVQEVGLQCEPRTIL